MEETCTKYSNHGVQLTLEEAHGGDNVTEKNTPIAGIVRRVVRDEGREPYVVTTAESFQEGSITFSLNPQVWSEDRDPEPSSEVIMTKLEKRRNGWRALSARFRTPQD